MAMLHWMEVKAEEELAWSRQSSARATFEALHYHLAVQPTSEPQPLRCCSEGRISRGR
jgi:hypothetical protein